MSYIYPTTAKNKIMEVTQRSPGLRQHCIVLNCIYIVCRSSKLLYQQLRHEMVLAVVPTSLCKVYNNSSAMMCCSHLAQDPCTMHTAIRHYRFMHVLCMLMARQWLCLREINTNVGCASFQTLPLYSSTCAPCSPLDSLAFLSSSSTHTL